MVSSYLLKNLPCWWLLMHFRVPECLTVHVIDNLLVIYFSCMAELHNNLQQVIHNCPHVIIEYN